MKIVISQHSGFCFGVKRAMDITLQESNSNTNKNKIATYGPLIHNPQVVEHLKEKNIDVIYNVDENTYVDKLIMPSHGSPKELFERCKELNISTIDATCPFVNAVHEKVKEFRDAGLLIVIIGDAGHSEVKGIMSWTDYNCIVISSEDDISKYDFKGKSVGIVSQTTNSLDFFENIANKIAELAEKTIISNTICSATYKRQETAAKLAPDVDLMLVVGGKNSANTKRLYQICKNNNPNVFHIETALEMKPEWFTGITTVGITAGASTPDWIINDIVKELKDINKE